MFLSKNDLLSEKELKEKLKELKKTKREIIPISIADDESLKKVKAILNGIADEKRAKRKNELEALAEEKQKKDAEEI